MAWTDERIDKLKTMWEGGKTASVIAEELGGVSRNAVIGKAHRLGLQSRPSPVTAKETESPAAVPAVKQAAPPAAVPAPPSQPAPPRRLVPARPSPEIAGKTTLLELSDKVCKWPVGHPGEPDFHFCGDTVNPGFPYCVQHCGQAYQAQMPRRDRRMPPPLPFGGPRVR
ncbi:GcrA cell cycle regulator [Sphingomonas antarctica]|uniref:GcrA family cell cycle regulator n=1 Tax=Sphingomonas antarctica TaxID=2040274 RepID=UPI0039EAC11C